MFGYRDPTRHCQYIGGTYQSFCWKVLKVVGIIIFLLYCAI